MSIYGVSQFCHRLTVDDQHRALAQRDPLAALDPFELTAAERAAIVTGDVARLVADGVHPLLVVRLCTYAIGGLTEAAYSQRMRSWAATRGPK